MSDETTRQDGCSWLIEGAAVYWCGRSPENFDRDVNKAVRFSRQEDAERVLHWIVPEQMRTLCRTAEHMWISPRIPSPDEAQPTIEKCPLCNCGFPHSSDLEHQTPAERPVTPHSAVFHKPKACPLCFCSQTLPVYIQECSCACHHRDREKPERPSVKLTREQAESLLWFYDSSAFHSEGTAQDQFIARLRELGIEVEP